MEVINRITDIEKAFRDHLGQLFILHRMALRSRDLSDCTKVKHSVISRAHGTVCVSFITTHDVFSSSTLPSNTSAITTLDSVSETSVLKSTQYLISLCVSLQNISTIWAVIQQRILNTSTTSAKLSCIPWLFLPDKISPK